MLILFLILGCVVFYFLIDPTKYVWIPKCPMRLLLGWNCPACGIQRALHALFNGHPAEALSYNYFFVFSIPYAFALILAELLKCIQRGKTFIRKVNNPVIAKIYIVLFVLWGVVRNLLDI